MNYEDLNRKDNLSQIQPVAAGGALTFLLVNGISQGDDFSSRNGRKAFLHSYEMRYVVGLPKITGATAGDADSMRLILFYDKQANGAAPATTDLLLTGATYLSPFNADNAARFIILHDELIDSIHTAGDATDWNEDRSSDLLNIDLSGLTTVYGGTGATITDINTGSLYLAYMSKRALIGMDLYSRLWFYP